MTTVVYTHTRLDNNQVFYVGIGTKRRAYARGGRNKYWYNIVSNHGYMVNITHVDLCWEEACSIEKYLISFYGRSDLKSGTLVNMTDGGEGRLNFSSEAKKSMSLKMTGEKNHRYGKRLSEEKKKHLSELWKGRVFSKETREKLSKRAKGGSNGAKKVIDTNTGFIYNSVKEAAKSLNISHTYLSTKLNNDSKNNTGLKLLKSINKAA